MELSHISLILAITSSLIVTFDLRRNPQSMRIMDAVWILTPLWSSIFGLLVYYWFGRERWGRKRVVDMRDMAGMEMPMRPMWQSITLSTLHCGAGCTLADIVGSIILLFVPITIAGSSLWGGWLFNYILALVIGVGFQYGAIKAMSHLSRSQIIIKALKADLLSLTAWQVGMCVWFYLSIFHLHTLPLESPLSCDFWFVMQQAMLVGFLLSLPVNYLLIRGGVKSGM